MNIRLIKNEWSVSMEYDIEMKELNNTHVEKLEEAV